MLKLRTVTASIDDLLLDPNNPRFVIDLNVKLDVSDEEVEAKQEELLRKFDFVGEVQDDAGFFSIDDLKDSMREIGYVGIDRIVVRRLPTGKFVVLEGNRRTATIKTLRRENLAAPPHKRLTDFVAGTLESLEVMELDCDGLSPSDVREKVNVLLGLRHYGSLLEWAPLPKAYNMYHNYMHSGPLLEEFVVEQKRIKDVATRLSIRTADVRKALKTYVAYLQLSKNFSGVKDKYYSLIEAAVTNRHLTGNGYLKIDDSTFEMDEPSQQRLNQVCQFERRESLLSDQTIVPKPQSMKLLGDLVAKAYGSPSGAIRDYARSQLAQVELGEINEETEKLTLDLESAVSSVKALEAAVAWVDALKELIEKQENELQIEEFSGIGNDLLRKDEVKKKLELLRRIYGV